MAIPRISSLTPLKATSSSLLLPPPASSRMLTFTMRKARNTSVLLLLGLVSFSIYLFFLQYPALSSSSSFLQRKPREQASNQIAIALDAIQHSYSAEDGYRLRLTSPAGGSGASASSGGGTGYSAGGAREQIRLSVSQELAAVSSFLASLPQNVIPSFVDPHEPIDPQLVLDFDSSGPRAAEEVQNMVQEVWTRYPVFLYSKLHNKHSRELKSTLEALQMFPQPMIIDVDTRDDADVLQPLIQRLTGALDLPILLIGGKHVGSMDKIHSLHQTGELQRMIKQSGGVVNGARKKHQRRK